VHEQFDDYNFHSFNHATQKGVMGSEDTTEIISEIGTKLGDGERGFVLFVIGPSEEEKELFTKAEEPPQSEIGFDVGVKVKINPTFEELKEVVVATLFQCLSKEDLELMGEELNCAYDFKGLAESWLECDDQDIMAVAVGPYLNLGFSVNCYQRRETAA